MRVQVVWLGSKATTKFLHLTSSAPGALPRYVIVIQVWLHHPQHAGVKRLSYRNLYSSEGELVKEAIRPCSSTSSVGYAFYEYWSLSIPCPHMESHWVRSNVPFRLSHLDSWVPLPSLWPCCLKGSRRNSFNYWMFAMRLLNGHYLAIIVQPPPNMNGRL